MINPYEVLGVGRDASQEEIRKAYKKLAGKYHPDRNPGDDSAESKFKELNEAYQLIGNPEARKRYDSGGLDEDFLRQSSQARDFNFSFEDIENDIFDQFFSGQFSQFFKAGQQGGSGRRRNPKGSDAHMNMSIEFEESILGGKRLLTRPNGRQIEIDIPAGIEHGKKLRYRGQGHPSPYGGPKGDLFIEVLVKDHPRYKRHGNDLEMELKVPLDVAVLGGNVAVDSPSGRFELKIPSHTSSGKKLRLKGKGVKGRGDLIVRAIVVLPENVDPELEALLKDWAQNKASQRAGTHQTQSAS